MRWNLNLFLSASLLICCLRFRLLIVYGSLIIFSLEARIPLNHISGDQSTWWLLHNLNSNVSYKVVNLSSSPFIIQSGALQFSILDTSNEKTNQ